MTEPAAPVQAPPTPAPPAPDSAHAENAAAGPEGGVPASAWGSLEGGGFAAKLGSGLRLSAEQLANREIDLSQMRQPMPGLHFRTAQFNTRAKRLDITADIAVPHLAEGEFRVRINRNGDISIRGSARRQLALPALGNPEFRLSITDEGQLAGSVTVEGADLLAGRRPRGFEATGSGTLNIVAGKVSGNGSVTLTYPDLGTGTVNFNFTEVGDLSADGNFSITPPFMNEIGGEIGVDEARNITATITSDVGAVGTSVPGLALQGGTVTVNYANGITDGSIANFSASYAGFGQVTIASATLDRNKNFSGNGSFALSMAGLAEVTGDVRLAGGNVTGRVTLSADDMPEGLPVTRGSITATLGENNALGFSGTLGVNLGPAGTGDISASYNDAGDFHLGGNFDLTIPGLTSAQVTVDYTNGDLSGEVQLPIDTALLPGLDGTVTVRYGEGRWSGETEMQYTADNGKLSGTLRITVAQNDEGNLQLGGGGSVTAQLMPRLAGTLTAEILPEGGVDISGAIEVTEPLELFPEERLDRELFRYSQNIPLWAMLVAIIRVRAGVRAGVGPGVFRNIRVEGSYTIGQEEADPSFSISGEMYIPAFVEGYVAFGAGLGLDVVLGSLTGGIEGVATAGIYGAISVVPELNYADGEWGIEGTATMAAGARLKLGLNAWAEVEALWVTVWEREWELASHTMSIGPDLGLQARMSYKFGQPEPPEIEMNSSDIDTESLIQDAMPEDGPAPSGAREALENRAEWQGALREQRAAAVPPEQSAQAQQGETPPQPAQQPGNSSGGGGGGGANGSTTNATGAQGQTPNANAQNQANADAAATDSSVQGAVPENEVPTAGDVRYPSPVTLATLDEPPAPLPRTKEQEQQDVDAARRVVDLASAQATNSDTLDAYFPAIKDRFRLASIGYVGDFDRGFKVHGGINPAFDRELTNEPLSGSGLPPAISDRHLTNITWTTRDLGGSQVGIGMVANPLGPDHPMGSEPASSAQGTLMGKLPTNPSVHDNKENRYIRGHLLNHHVGGPGTPRNMFPITAKANEQHLNSIERQVKTWVNTNRYWVRYEVEVSGGTALDARGTQMVDGTSRPMFSVNSSFVATASVLGTNLQPVQGLTRRVTINSVFRPSSNTSVGLVTSTDQFESVDSAAAADFAEAMRGDNPNGPAVDPIQAASDQVDVQLPPSGSGPPTFDPVVLAALRTAIAKFGGGARGRGRVKEKLMGHPGFGQGSADLLISAYDEVYRRSDKTVNSISQGQRGTFSRIISAWGQGLGARLL